MHPRRAVLLGTLLFAAGLFAGRAPLILGAAGLRHDWSAAFDESRRLILDRALWPANDATLMQGAIDGMLATLGDPYSEFIPPALADGFDKALSGRFSGIGASLAQSDAGPVVIEPVPASPAYAAGLAPGDLITRIDGAPAAGLSIDRAAELISGPEGSTVTLTVERTTTQRHPPDAAGPPAGHPSATRTLTQDLTLTRGPIAVPSVRGVRFDPASAAGGAWQYLLDPALGVAYVRIEQFTATTADETAAALAQARAQAGGEPAALILDLRSNPGGALDQATLVADMFLDHGVIVSTLGRAQLAAGPSASVPPQSVLNATPGTSLPASVPALVLVDGLSASASEVLAGALRDNERAAVMGSRTFGKGAVQTIEPLLALPRAYLKLTEQLYALPSGRVIQRQPDAQTWGIDPDPGLAVTLTDAQTQALLLGRRAHQTVSPLPAQAAPRWDDPSWIESAVGDVQLAAALRAARAKLAGGPWDPAPTPTTPARAATPAAQSAPAPAPLP